MRPIKVNENLYEVNERGDRALVRSLESTHRAFIRFTNRTSRPVDIWWRNFEGHRQHYIRLPPGGMYNVNTYLTHPWEFTDGATGENFVINNNIVFRVPNVVARMRYRTTWNISVPVRSLRHTALLAVSQRLRYPNMALELDLPRSLSNELRALVDSYVNMIQNLEHK